jgi:hypothetical protein
MKRNTHFSALLFAGAFLFAISGCSDNVVSSAFPLEEELKNITINRVLIYVETNNPNPQILERETHFFDTEVKDGYLLLYLDGVVRRSLNLMNAFDIRLNHTNGSVSLYY